MNNNKQNQIRQGLTQFVGALIDNLSGDKEAVAQLVAASLSEEALKISIKDNKINYFIAKPILRATIIVLKQRYEEIIQSINSLKEDNSVKKVLIQQTSALKISIDVLQSMVNAKRKEDINNNGNQ